MNVEQEWDLDILQELVVGWGRLDASLKEK
jgi:hypothetical protein